MFDIPYLAETPTKNSSKLLFITNSKSSITNKYFSATDSMATVNDVM